MPEGPCTLGIDCGTSGLRGVVVDATGAVVATAQRPFPAGTTDPAVWAMAMALMGTPPFLTIAGGNG